MALMAAAAARPSPKAAPKEPIATVSPAVMMEIMEMMASSFMLFPFLCLGYFCNGRRDINQRQDGEYVCLDEAGQQPQHLHCRGKEEGCDREQNGGNHGTAHYVAV